jgi:hypothetical protein
MSSYRDAEVTDVVVVLDDLNTDLTNACVKKLEAAGLSVSRVDDEQSVVEGSIDAGKVRDLEHVENVRYVRSIITYSVDYPPGDPRDRNGM